VVRRLDMMGWNEIFFFQAARGFTARGMAVDLVKGRLFRDSATLGFGFGVWGLITTVLFEGDDGRKEKDLLIDVKVR
jgi:hypothetical protein